MGRVRLWWPVVALLLVAAVAWLWPRPDAGPAVVVPAAEVTAALAQLDGLAVKGRAPKTGYDREQFGDGWADADGNGCDTRNDMLARDLTRAQARHPRLRRAHRHAARPVRRHRDRVLRGRAARRCRSTTSWRCRRLAEGRPAVDAGAACRVRQRPAEPARRRRRPEPGQGRRRRGDLAAAGPLLPLPVRDPAGRGEGEVGAVGHGRGTRTPLARELGRCRTVPTG